MYVLIGLKVFFDEVIDLYKSFFKKTYPGSFLISVYAGLLTAVLYLIVPDQKTVRDRGDFFDVYFYSYSSTFNYLLTDLSIILFMTLIAFSAISMHRSRNNGERGSSLSFTNGLNANDIGNVLIACIIACAGDFALSYIYNIQFDKNGAESVSRIVLFKRIIYYIRSYLPVMVLAVAVYRSLYPGGYKLNMRILLVVLIAAWLARGISLHSFSLFDNLIMQLPRTVVPDRDTVYIVNIFICLPFLALIVPGYMGVMYLPGLLAENGFAENGIEAGDGNDTGPETEEGLNEVETMYPFKD